MPAKSTKEQKEDLAADLEATHILFRELASAGDDDVAAKSTLRQIRSLTRGFSHEQRHGGQPCPMVEADIPLHPTGVPYSIGRKPYQGHIRAHRCVVHVLLNMVSMAQQVERERMREPNRVGNIDLSARLRAIHVD